MGTLIHYPIPLYRRAAYGEMDHLRDNFPISNAISEQILSLPISPQLSKGDVKYVCEKVNSFF
ncbi:MAG: DegT/DnrJ/EryC1/StrS family aminotransferase [Desulfobacteraceae bacterium]|nr:DegT/DnrJ/EryC1/StrS family aminotransferase [Desulfobacteraceae bacterium]